ncbi:MAG: hypothetical protein AAGF98_13890, partial [Cyanobacteria bacterium P01_H01_bin.153]
MLKCRLAAGKATAFVGFLSRRLVSLGRWSPSVPSANAGAIAQQIIYSRGPEKPTFRGWPNLSYPPRHASVESTWVSLWPSPRH